MMTQPTPKPRAKIGDVVAFFNHDSEKYEQCTILASMYDKTSNSWGYGGNAGITNYTFMEKEIIYNLTTGESYD